MAFDLELVFTGVYGLVPDNADLGKVRKLCAVLPNAVNAHIDGPKALDGRTMRRHVGMLRFPLKHLVGVDTRAVPAESQAFWQLDRTRLRIAPRGIEYPNNPAGLKFAWVDPASVDMSKPLSPEQRRSYHWALDLADSLPTKCEVDSEILSQDNVPASVLAQVVLGGGGEVATGSRIEDLPTSVLWKMTPWLKAGDPKETYLAHGVSVTYRGITGVDLLLTKLDEPYDLRTFAIEADDGELVRVCISNMCDQNPLEWPWPFDPERDEDTRWLYELLSMDSKRALQTILPGAGLPLPQPVPRAGGGPNCVGGRFAGWPFEVEA